MSANSRYKTYTGREFNMSAFAEKNGDTKAVGNSSMNGRGDIVDARGKVTIPNQTISRANSALLNSGVQQVSLKADETVVAPIRTESVKAGPTIVSSKLTADGLNTEVAYSDGSIQIIPLTVTPSL